MSKVFTRRGFIRTTSGLAMSAAAHQVGMTSTGIRHHDRIKVGQIGTGHGHAAGKMRVLRENPDFEVVGVVEADPELKARAQRSDTYRDLKWMSQEELLNTTGLRAVAVETRVEQLLDTADACLDAGMHIHLDKPAGLSLPHFKSVQEKARRKDLTIQLGYMFRYNPGIAMMRDFLQRGWLGEPFEMHCVISKRTVGPGRGDPARFTGGMMFELGCHMIDLVVAMMGHPHDVTGFIQNTRHYDDGLADNCLAVFEFPRALATVKTSVLEVDGGSRRHVVLCGTEGTFHVQPMSAPKGQLTLLTPRGDYQEKQEVTLPPYRRYVDDIRDFGQLVRGEKENDFTYEHDYQVQESVLRASDMPLA